LRNCVRTSGKDNIISPYLVRELVNNVISLIRSLIFFYAFGLTQVQDSTISLAPQVGTRTNT
jgi:hypothetical protein